MRSKSLTFNLWFCFFEHVLCSCFSQKTLNLSSTLKFGCQNHPKLKQLLYLKCLAKPKFSFLHLALIIPVQKLSFRLILHSDKESLNVYSWAWYISIQKRWRFIESQLNRKGRCFPRVLVRILVNVLWKNWSQMVRKDKFSAPLYCCHKW